MEELTLENLLKNSKVTQDKGVNGVTMAKWLQGNASLIPKLASLGYSVTDLVNEAYSQTRTNKSAFSGDMTVVSRDKNSSTSSGAVSEPTPTDTSTADWKQPLLSAGYSEEQINKAFGSAPKLNADGTFTANYKRPITGGGKVLGYSERSENKTLEDWMVSYTSGQNTYWSIGTPTDTTTDDTTDDTIDDTTTDTDTTADTTTNTALSSLFQGMIDLDPFLVEQLADPDKKLAFDSLDDSLKMQYLMNMRALGDSIKAGQIINPDLEITPEQATAFEDQAKDTIAGYYDELIGFETGDLKTSLQRMKDDYTTSLGRAEETFKTGLGTQAESEAQAGLAFGSERGVRESKTIRAQQEGLDDASLAMAREKQDLATTTERRIGSEAFGQLGLDTSTQRYNVNAQGFNQAGSRSLFTPSGDLVGELPKQRQVDVINEKNALITAERQKRVLDNSSLSGNALSSYSGLIETPKTVAPTGTKPTITLPNGQKISGLDPNYENFKNQYKL